MKLGLFGIVLFAASALTVALSAAEPVFTSDGKLQKPADYREWVYLSSGLGMNYAENATESANPVFDNVFVEPSAYRAFMATGKWPEKTMFALELRRSSQKGSINKAGRFQTELSAVEIAVKDTQRFPDGWAYFGFPNGANTAAAFGADAGCNACHSKNGAVENTFVQFYPTLLEVAKAKGTLRQSYIEAEAQH